MYPIRSEEWAVFIGVHICLFCVVIAAAPIYVAALTSKAPRGRHTVPVLLILVPITAVVAPFFLRYFAGAQPEETLNLILFLLFWPALPAMWSYIEIIVESFRKRNLLSFFERAAMVIAFITAPMFLGSLTVEHFALSIPPKNSASLVFRMQFFMYLTVFAASMLSLLIYMMWTLATRAKKDRSGTGE